MWWDSLKVVVFGVSFAVGGELVRGLWMVPVALCLMLDLVCMVCVSGGAMSQVELCQVLRCGHRVFSVQGKLWWE